MLHKATKQFVVIDDILKERSRQDELWGEQNHNDINVSIKVAESCLELERLSNKLSVQRGQLTWRHILGEETAEAYLAAAQGNEEALREELVQVAAVAIAWIEALDRRTLVKTKGPIRCES